MARDGCSYCFSFWAMFLRFYTPNSPKNEHFKKMKKRPGDIIILHNCTKNYGYSLYCSCDMAGDGFNYFSLWVIFCPFAVRG